MHFARKTSGTEIWYHRSMGRVFFMKRFFMMLFAMVMIPYVTTLAWTGRIRTDAGAEVPAEEFLVGVVAAEIPAEYGIETLKAQAVLARTYVYRIVDPEISVRSRENGSGTGEDSGNGAAGTFRGISGTLDRTFMEEELDIDCLSVREMEKKWGKDHFEEYYEKVRQAVRETEGIVAECDGELIEPFYCLASAGKTRELAAYPYLCSVESPGDMEVDGFLSVRTFTEAEFADKIGKIGGPRPAADGIAGKIQIIERDNAGYVKRVQIRDMDYTGDEVRDSLGLQSSCFHFSSADGKIRVSSRGIGSGYGFSQAGADAMEREQGSGVKELLKYYFQGIEVVKIAE